MKGRTLLLLGLSVVTLVSATLMPILLVASSGQIRATVIWLSFMEFFTPAMIFGLALTIHFVLKARSA